MIDMMESRQVPTNAISRLAYELGMSDGELARKAGITRSRLNRIKNGRLRPSIRDALLISRALDSSLDAVFSCGSSRTLDRHDVAAVDAQ